jgi:hypothetical protein
MKQLLLFILVLPFGLAAQICDPSANLIIYSSYDGGLLEINVDEDTGPLYIGVASYEFARIEITGTYAYNVAAVWYAGYDADNDHCDLGAPLFTTIVGVDAAITQIEFLPTSPLIEGDLPTYIIYNYQCLSEPYSGNSPEQLVAYFAQMGSGNLRYHSTQYGCWSGVQNISDGGNCCLTVEVDVPGCTDSTALNYNPNATVDDGSCVYEEDPVPGCTDPEACNFDPLATEEDGSCVFVNSGCTDASACNYEPTALTDNGYCHYLCYGCFDLLACNYDPDATIDDSSCDFSCYGCTYPEAGNYDPVATRDDGSCDYTCAQDINNDAIVNTQDLLLFLQAFGTICD